VSDSGGQQVARGVDDPHARQARNAVYAVFIGNGVIFASWASRIPQVRSELRVSPGVLGLILLCIAVGSTIATPLSGVVINWLGEARTVVVMSLTSAAGVAVVAVGYRLGLVPAAAGLFLFGFGSGAWDVAMNVQGAAVERALGRTILPKFHAGWSIGTVAGAAVGAAMVALGVPVTAHLLAVAVAVAVAVPAAARKFLPGTRPAARSGTGKAAARHGPLAAWTETRTLLIGLFVLCMAFTEGTGNDWLSLAVIDGYHTAAVIGTLTLAIFLAAMTAGRWFGPRLIDRYGRVPVLRACAATALAGLLMIDFGAFLAVALAGAVLMGLGTSLGFPVGLSSAADDPRYAATRVSTAASIGYLAFLAGPPAVGFLGDHIGVLHSLSIAAVLLAAALVLCRATAPACPPSQATHSSRQHHRAGFQDPAEHEQGENGPGRVS
jgi:predicted MFS family arabinose efflux permease